MKITILAAAVAVALCGCAQTVLYRDGKPIARFQGDMTGIEYRMDSNGSVTWKAATVDHSSATAASAARIKLAGSAVAASGLTLLLK
jgi:hypothetical protein